MPTISAKKLKAELTLFKNWIEQQNDKLKFTVIGGYQVISDSEKKEPSDFLNKINSRIARNHYVNLSPPSSDIGHYISTSDFLNDIDKILSLNSEEELKWWAEAWYDVINRLLQTHGKKTNLSSYLSSFKPIFHYRGIDSVLLDTWFSKIKNIAKYLRIFINTKPWHFSRQAEFELDEHRDEFSLEDPSIDQVSQSSVSQTGHPSHPLTLLCATVLVPRPSCLAPMT